MKPPSRPGFQLQWARGINMTPGEQSTPNGFDEIKVLRRHRLSCGKKGKYQEAKLATARIEQLLAYEGDKWTEDLRSQQHAQRLDIEEKHMREMQELNESWDKLFSDFEANAATIQNTLVQRQKAAYHAFVAKLREKAKLKKPQWSRELLQLRKIQSFHAKLKQYDEAEKTQADADRLEAKERALWKSQTDDKFAVLEEQFLMKQKLEMAGLLKRIKTYREENIQLRFNDLENLIRHYHNVKTQAESQQKIEQQRVYRYPLLGPWLHANGLAP